MIRCLVWSPPSREERGSILIAFMLVMFILLMVAAVGVDLGRYILLQERTQHTADGAALAGAEALNQFSDVPDQTKAYRAALDFIEGQQGKSHVDLYEVRSDGTVDGIMVEQLHEPSGDTFYRVGVLAFQDFEPLFLPRAVFGDDPHAIVTEAVAQLDSRHVQSVRGDSSPMDCGLIVDGDTTLGVGVGIKGNNFNVADGDLCAEVPVTFEKGKDHGFTIQQLKTEPCTDQKNPPTKACADRETYGDPKAPPEFRYDNPAPYIVDMSEFNTWSPGPCSGSGRALETKSDTPVTWGAGGPQVCVQKTTGGPGSYDGYDFTNESGDQMQTADGEPVSVYADDSLRFTDNNGGVSGGVYSTEDIVIGKNSGQFVGETNELGGLSVWAERDLIVRKNNTYFEGIVGAGRDVRFTSSGGGKHEIRGIVIAGRNFIDHANTNSRDDITYDPSVFLQSALDMGGWFDWVLGNTDRPDFSNTTAYLIH